MLVLSLSLDEASQDSQFFAVPKAVRPGGILLALPENAFTGEALLAGQSHRLFCAFPLESPRGTAPH